MSELTGILTTAFGIGVGATLLMDLWSALLRHMGVATLNYAMLGRWCGHWLKGIWFHKNIREAAAVPSENVMGWTLHYVTGIAFAVVFVCVSGPHWMDVPTLVPALIFGGATVFLPWLLLQPALGAGLAGAKTPHPWQSRAAGLATHLVFGVGLYLSAQAIAFI